MLPYPHLYLETAFQPRPDRPKRGGKKSSKTGGGGKEAESLPDIPETEPVKDSPDTKPQPQPSTPVKQEEEPVIHTDCIVFAKFKVGCIVKFINHVYES